MISNPLVDDFFGQNTIFFVDATAFVALPQRLWQPRQTTDNVDSSVESMESTVSAELAGLLVGGAFVQGDITLRRRNRRMPHQHLCGSRRAAVAVIGC